MGNINPHSNYLGKWERLNFVSSWSEWGSTPGIIKVTGLSSDRSQRALELLLERRQRKQSHEQTVWKEQSGEPLGQTVGKSVAHLGVSPKEAAFMERHLWKQRTWKTPFSSPTPQLKDRATCRNEHNLILPNLLTQRPTHHAPMKPPPLPRYTCLNPSAAGPLPTSPRRPPQTPAHIPSPKPGILQGLSSSVNGKTSLFTSRLGHT